MLGNRTLRKTLGLKKEEITGGWRKLCMELHDMYFSRNFIMIIKGESMGLAGRMVGNINACRVSVGIPNKRDHS
jgi:hypothetical protein